MRLIVVGNPESVLKYVNNYIKENEFLDLEIERFENSLKIEDVRTLKKSLAFKVKSKKLYIFFGEFTTEAQNSLLKFIEEPQENTSFIFCTKNENDLLPTVRSRCKIITLVRNELVDEKVKDLLSDIGSNPSKAYDLIESLHSYLEGKDPEILYPAVRQLFLENYSAKQNAEKYYSYCKKTILFLPLVQTNNVNRRIIFEKIFLSTQI